MGLYWGWKTFWFLTDDAFIAFRYVSNRILGYGYTWNPPPFRPVEGYTSFLWVVLLDFVWRILGVRPPKSANILSLGFSYLTLGLIVWSVMRMKLQPRLEHLRVAFLALVLLGILTNRTFLAWTSSGLETALFNFCFIFWITIVVFRESSSYSWLFGVTLSAVLTYLSRPDGALAILATLLLIILSFLDRFKQKNLNIKWLLSISPLVVALGHLVWRRAFYGEWLPNTYYSKHISVWPEAGIKYLLSFFIEYGLWVWLALLFLLVFMGRKAPSNKFKRAPLDKEPKGWLENRFTFFKLSLPRIAGIAVVLAYITYYTLIIGGDHFEYRIFSFLIPLIFVSFLWIVNELNLKPANAVAVFCLFILFSLPIPWVHWRLTKNLNTRETTYRLWAPVSNEFPLFIRWYTEIFDYLQNWLIYHAVCMRHQEHKTFYELQRDRYPTREEGERINPGGYPVMALKAVGVPGWVLPHVVIIDELGLNDYVIARNLVSPSNEKIMAHERSAPEGYVESFSPNMRLVEPGRIGLDKRESDLTPERIIAAEKYWIDRVRSKGGETRF